MVSTRATLRRKSPLGDDAHTVVDGTAQITVAVELSNNAADADRLPVLIDVVRVN